jgi:hypothetical protein
MSRAGSSSAGSLIGSFAPSLSGTKLLYETHAALYVRYAACM